MGDRSVKASVLLSGSGRTLENLLDRIGADTLPLQITSVVSSRAGVRGLQVAEGAGIPVGVFKRRDFADMAGHNDAINAWLGPFEPRLIILAGYLCFYQQPAGFTGAVVNIHPALLPLFSGMVQEHSCNACKSQVEEELVNGVVVLL